MRRLILHIGTHKTGTSSIQSWLKSRRMVLKEHGFWYGATDRPPHPELPKHSSLYRALATDHLDFDVEKRMILEDFDRSGCDTLILSEEGLSEPYFRRLERAAEFGEHFEVEIVCFLRRQDHFLESLWNQRSRQGTERRPIEAFVTSDYARQVTAYLRKLDFWAGIGKVSAIAYDEQAQQSVSQFAALLGVPVTGPVSGVNPSPSMNHAAVCNLLNRWRLPYHEAPLAWLFRHDQRRHALGRRLRAELLESFAARNAILARHFSRRVRQRHAGRTGRAAATARFPGPAARDRTAAPVPAARCGLWVTDRPAWR